MNIKEARQQAQDENIALKILVELANSKDSLTRQYVTANPNTPTEVLLKLGAEFPRELLDNPIFDLLLLENPNLIEEIPIVTLRNLVKQDNVPESFIIECAERESDKDLLLGLTMNPNISRSILEKLNQSKFAEVAEAAKLHINWSGEITEGWQEIAKNKIIDLSNNYVSSESNSDIATMICANLLPEFFLNYFKNTQVGEYIFKRIAETQKNKKLIEKPIFSFDSSHRKCDWQNEDSDLRINAATNPKTSQAILEKLSNDSDKFVRYSLFSNPNTPAYILEKLSEDCKLKRLTREKLISHPNTSHKLLNKIWEELLSKTRNNPNEWQYLKQELIAFTTNIATPSWLLKAIFDLDYVSNGWCPFVYHRIAAHPNTPIEILENIIDLIDKKNFLLDMHIRGIIENPKLPIHLWQKIFNDLKIKKNANNIKAVYYFCQYYPEKVSLIVEDYTNASSDLVRLIALLYLPVETIKLNKITKYTNWLYRYGVTQNKNVSLEQLKILAKDANKIVRAAAKDNLEKKEKASS